MKVSSQTISRWIPLAVMATIIFSSMYLVAQYVIRSGVEEPLLQISEDYAELSKLGDSQGDMSQFAKVDLSQSIAPVAIVLDAEGSVVQTTGILNEGTPVPPREVLEKAKRNGQNRVTWEPAKEVSLAAVVTYFEGENTGYSIAARNIRETESREKKVAILLILGYGTTLLASLTASILANLASAKKQTK